ncbi:MAG: pilus assembly protein FimV [Oceanicoccus sp.]|jgi:pilus assembly protein FimV
MVRNKLAATIAAIGALQATMVGALGMGEFTLNSALNQPLDAEIRLTNTDDLDRVQVLIGLAEASDFVSAGVSRDFFLTNLKFNVELDGKGGGVIKVTTREAVVEPYLNFLVETRWPSGRMLREYTVLLDLPVFSDSAAKPVVAASTAATKSLPPKPAVSASSNWSSSQSSRSPSAAKNINEASLQAGEEYRVKSDDTLWAIALKARSGGNSVQQTMLGIQQQNPDAFQNGNINRLKAGSVLRLPTADEIRVTERQAIGEVANQNKAWKQGDDVQLDATSSSEQVDELAASEPRLSIASGGSSDDSAMGDGAGTEGGSGALASDLDIAEETLDKAKRENDELASRLGDMEIKMATLQRLIALKDDQLADMQQNVTNKDEQSAAAEPIAKSVTKVTPKAKPADESLWDQIVGNPLYAGAAGALLLAIIALLIMRRRKADQEELDQQLSVIIEDESIEDISVEDGIAAIDEPVMSAGESEQEDTEHLVAELEEQIAADNAAEEAREAEIEQPSDTVVVAPIADSAVESETGDAISEADIYVAYGRYQQAVDLLRNAIDKEPERADLQVKLLEVYVETRDKSGFQQQYQTLQGLGDEQAIIDIKENLSSVDGVADWLDDLPEAAPAVVAAVADDGLDLELGEDFDIDMDLDFESDFDEADLATTQELAALNEMPSTAGSSADDFDLEADLELGDTLAADDISDSRTMIMSNDDLAAGDELGDLGLDEEFSLTDELTADDAFELDLDEGIDLEDDLDLNALADADLGDLEAEFGEVDTDISKVAAELEREVAGSIDTPQEIEFDLEDDVELDLAESLDEIAVAAVAVDDGGSVTAEPAGDDDFDFLADTDEVATKLDLARAYIDMGDSDGAKDILDEVLQEGNDEQKQEAQALAGRMD